MYTQYFEIQCKTETFFPSMLKYFSGFQFPKNFSFFLDLHNYMYVGTDTQFSILSYEDLFLLFG